MDEEEEYRKGPDDIYPVILVCVTVLSAVLPLYLHMRVSANLADLKAILRSILAMMDPMIPSSVISDLQFQV